MERSEYEKAASYWTKKEAALKRMEPEELKAEIDAYLSAHNTCALATGTGSFVRCTPIEYTYLEDKIWLISEGGLKFNALAENENVCLAIFDPYQGFGKLGGMQVEGTAKIIEPFSETYLHVLEIKKIPVKALKNLDHTMYMICITPSRIDYLSSEIKKRGYDSRQFLIYPER